MPATSPWGHSQFRRILVSTASFTLGTQIYQLGMPLILYELTKSAAAMTAIAGMVLLIGSQACSTAWPASAVYRVT